jgi:iron complex outermembrane receptor protein
VSHELLSVQLSASADAYVAERASPTRHRGIEAGLDSTVWQGDAARLSLAGLHLQRFRYRDDAASAAIACRACRSLLSGERRLDTGTGVSVALNTEYASRMPVDTPTVLCRCPPDLGAELGYAPVGKRWNGWLQLRNPRRPAALCRHGHARLRRRRTGHGAIHAGEGFGIYAGMAWRWE